MPLKAVTENVAPTRADAHNGRSTGGSIRFSSGFHRCKRGNVAVKVAGVVSIRPAVKPRLSRCFGKGPTLSGETGSA